MILSKEGGRGLCQSIPKGGIMQMGKLVGNSLKGNMWKLKSEDPAWRLLLNNLL